MYCCVQETPMPTAVPVATPQPAAGPLVPLLGGESAAAPVLAPGQAPALTPEAAPAPSPEPSLNAACAENGTNNGKHPLTGCLVVSCHLVPLVCCWAGAATQARWLADNLQRAFS